MQPLSRPLQHTTGASSWERAVPAAVSSVGAPALSTVRRLCCGIRCASGDTSGGACTADVCGRQGTGAVWLRRFPAAAAQGCDEQMSCIQRVSNVCGHLSAQGDMCRGFGCFTPFSAGWEQLLFGQWLWFSTIARTARGGNINTQMPCSGCTGDELCCMCAQGYICRRIAFLPSRVLAAVGWERALG